MTTMTTTHELILSAIARRVDPEDAQLNPGASTPLPGFHPRLVLEPGKSYDLRLTFWLHLVLPDGAVTAAPFFEVGGSRTVGDWVESVVEGEAPGRGHVRGEQVFPDVASPDGSLVAGLLIRGTGASTVGHLTAIAGDPRDRAADAAWRAVAGAAHAETFAGATDDPGAIVLIAGITS